MTDSPARWPCNRATFKGGATMKHQYYWYRGGMIERFGKGWLWVEQACSGKATGIPVYKTVEDARNAIRKALDSTQKAEPRIIQTVGFKIGEGWYIEND